MSTVTETAELLEKAAQILVTNGWYQDDFYDFTEAQKKRTRPSECRVCAYGALNIAVTGAPSAPHFDEDEDAVDAAAYAVLGVMGIEGADLAAWNDQPGRTAQDVIDAMRTTAETLRKQVTK